MMDDSPRDAAPPAARVPTLTEVIDATDPSSWRAAWSDGADSPAESTVDVDATVAPDPPIATAATPADQDDRLRDVLAAALVRFDADADHRLRQALQPILAEAADRLVAAARSELASSLRDLMAGSVAIDHAAPPDRRGADPSSL